jgi:hypothetical protein
MTPFAVPVPAAAPAAAAAGVCRRNRGVNGVRVNSVCRQSEAEPETERERAAQRESM